MPASAAPSASFSSPASPRTTPASRSPTRAAASIPTWSRPRASACACSRSWRATGASTAPTAAARSGSRSTAARAASAAPPDARRRAATPHQTFVHVPASLRVLPSASAPAIPSLRCMPRRDQRLLLGLAALTLAFALVQSATGISADVLLAAPALILLLPLLAGRYVGEDGIARLSAMVAAARRRPVAVRAAQPRRAPRVLARGGRLIAVALAHRGPPAARLAL